MNSVPACAETIHVTIDQLIFAPVEIKAKVGDTVEWINKDIVAHTATVRDVWDVMVEPDKSASLVLTKAGSVEYYCRFHPNMTGRITVTPAANEPRSAARVSGKLGTTIEDKQRCCFARTASA